MSRWTHILGAIKIEGRYLTKKANIRHIEQVIKSAPKVTGSENDMSVIFQNTGISNMSICAKSIKNYYTEYIITVYGNLRDRSLEQTHKEFFEFMDYLSKNVLVFDFNITIHDAYNEIFSYHWNNSSFPMKFTDKYSNKLLKMIEKNSEKVGCH